ncbi:Pol, partial [Symbiodinium sp. KB8]
MRAALCLVGQLSSPLQALWILAHVRCWAAEAFASHALCPLQELCRYQEYLLQQRQDTWLTPSLQAGGTVQLQGEFAATRVQIPGPVKLCRLLQALKAGLAPGLLVRVSDGFRALPAHAFLHPQPFGPTYLVQTFVKRARLENDSASANQSVDLALAPELLSETLSVATPGASSATITSQPQPSPVQASPCGDHLVLEAPSPSFATTLKDGTPPLTQQLEASSPASLAHSYVGPSPRVPASADLVREPSPSFPSGCTDLAVWCSLSAVMRMCPAFQALLLPPRVADVLLRLALSGQALPPSLAAAAQLRHDHVLLAPFVHEGHWTLLTLRTHGSLVQATVFDGVPGRNASAAYSLAASLCFLGGCSLDTFLERTIWTQSSPADCGAVLVAHALSLLPAPACDHPLQTARAFLAALPAFDSDIVGLGGLAPEQEQELQQLLVQKGKSAKRLPAPLHIDPGQLQLSEGSFITKAGGPLKQLSFDEVQAQASGICFCTVEQAGPFLALGRNLSVDALALATTAELPDPSAPRTSAVRYPAVFAPTQEAILVSGSLVQLGDEEVQLCATDIAEVEHLSTAVCRLSLFRDEYKNSWEKFCEAPLRVLLHQVPEFQVCKDPACGGKCLGFHAAVDEVVEHLFLDVWARQWVRLAGGKAKPVEAELFQAFLRLPASALPHVFNTSLDGLYMEPRAADGTGPHAAWAVVWLPGQTGAQAQLAMRTTEKALAVTRLGHKFGLRTKEADEQAVFELLRPQHHFLKVRITARFRLHPLPHGFQRHNLVQLLKQWQWNCKPLQPDRGDSVGCAWIVGASCDPPALALPLGQGFVLATKIRDVGQPRGPSKEVCASVRTRRALLLDDDPDLPVDPWADGSDPWSVARVAPQAASSSNEAVTKIAQLEAGLKQDLQDIVQRKLDEREAAGPPPGLSDQDKRLHALETTVTE